MELILSWLQTLLLQTGGSYGAGLGAVGVGRHRQSKGGKVESANVITTEQEKQNLKVESAFLHFGSNFEVFCIFV